MPERQADARAALVLFFRSLYSQRSIVVVDPVQPLRVRLGAQDEHRVVGQGDPLRRPNRWGLLFL